MTAGGTRDDALGNVLRTHSICTPQRVRFVFSELINDDVCISGPAGGGIYRAVGFRTLVNHGGRACRILLF